MVEKIVGAVGLLGIILCSAFFSAVELAFTSFSSVRLYTLLEKGAQGAKSLERLRKNKRRVIISILIWNNLLNIAASALATSVAISYYGEEGIGVAIGVMTFVILTLGEIIPKSVSTVHGEALMLLAARPLEFIYFITYPAVLFFEQFNRLIPGVYARPTTVERFSEDEVRSAVKLGAQNKGITGREMELIENVLAFKGRTVAQAMTPRNVVVGLPAEISVASAYELAVKSKYSRFPVMSKDKVKGTVSIKMLCREVKARPGEAVSKVALKPISFKPNVRASNAFVQLQELGRNVAIVESSKGTFLGVVTLEDLMEELVGEIE